MAYSIQYLEHVNKYHKTGVQPLLTTIQYCIFYGTYMQLRITPILPVVAYACKSSLIMLPYLGNIWIYALMTCQTTSI